MSKSGLHLAETLRYESDTLDIWMLGRFRVSAESRTIEDNDWQLKKSASVVKLLALQPLHRMHRDRVLDLLWPDLPPQKAINNLYRTLHEARRMLNPEIGPRRYLQLRDGQLILSPDKNQWIDAGAFESAAATARNLREPAAYRRALELYGGELLPDDIYEDWSQEPRNQLARLHQDLCIELADLYEERGEHGRSIEILERVLVENPTLEEAHTALMRLYALTGRRNKALGQYESLKDALWREMKVEPGPEAEHLYSKIASGEISNINSFSELSMSEVITQSDNLPTPKTSFVGREREVSELEHLLENTRLLTLTGVGGSGKTRLALEVARELLERYPGGVWMVGLSSISDPGLVVPSAAQVFGVREQPEYPLSETLAVALRDEELLLVLDNCEQVVEEVASLVGTLLDNCRKLRVLATSRELLRVEGEISWTVPPLSLPGPNDEPAIEELQESESVRLFVDRAVQRDTAFSLTRQNSPSVAEICRKLDGIPLAIELAAARIGMLGADQISEKLEDDLRLLGRGPRASEPRQQTLRGALDWSYDLLGDQERRLFRQLAVFAGGFTLEAAEQVATNGSARDSNFLELLSSLVDKSLVEVGERRYRLLEPVRQYALDKLKNSNECEEILRRHALWCVELAEKAEPELTGPDQGLWIDRLETEHDNLRAALGWALEGGNPALGLRLAGSLWLFWYTHGHTGEGRRWLELGISLRGNVDLRLKARALNGAGWIAVFQRDYETAEKLLEEGADLYRELGDAEGVGACLSNMLFGAVLADRDIEDYRWCMNEIDAIWSQLTHSRTLANIMLICGIMKLGEGKHDRARSAYEEALGLYRTAGDIQGTAMTLFNLAFEAIVRGAVAETTRWSVESLQVSRRQDDKLAIMYALWMLGCCAADEGSYERSTRLWGASEALQETHGMRPAPVVINLVDYEKRLDRARRALGEERVKCEWEKGATMSLDQAISYALSDEFDALTPREAEVAELVAQGFSNRRISEELTVSERTVHTHIQNIFKKLGASSRVEVAERLRQSNH